MTTTLTLELTEQTRAALFAAADVQGKDPAQLVTAHLELIYKDCDAEAYPKIANALRDDSNDISLEDFVAQRSAERAQRSATAPAQKVLTAA